MSFFLFTYLRNYLYGQLDSEALCFVCRSSFIVSADMAHAVHPNYADKHEPGHKPRFGDGVVIKHNANQRYATDAVTAWLFRELGERAGVPVQVSVFIFTYCVITYLRSTTMGDWTDALCLTLITGVCRSLRPRVRQHHRAYPVHQDRDTDSGRRGAAAVDAQRPRDVRVCGYETRRRTLHGGVRRIHEAGQDAHGGRRHWKPLPPLRLIRPFGLESINKYDDTSMNH